MSEIGDGIISLAYTFRTLELRELSGTINLQAGPEDLDLVSVHGYVRARLDLRSTGVNLRLTCVSNEDFRVFDALWRVYGDGLVENETLCA